MKITLERTPSKGWLVRGGNCYAIINLDGSRRIFAKPGELTDDFKDIVSAMTWWCIGNATPPETDR